jgi:hypothetical protein
MVKLNSLWEGNLGNASSDCNFNLLQVQKDRLRKE